MCHVSSIAASSKPSGYSDRATVAMYSRKFSNSVLHLPRHSEMIGLPAAINLKDLETQTQATIGDFRCS